MQNICKKSLGILCSSLLIFSGVMHSMTAKALDNGIYTAKCTPYYVHPVTGVVEDRGGIESQGIGQPMTDSATYPTALIEVDPNGNTYATVRLSLMDNIENVSFKVQADGNAPFNDVDYDIMQENLDDNTTDFRMQIPSENSYLRATFYVVPMSRDVVYYIGFSDLQPGSADFVTSVEVLSPTEQPQMLRKQKHRQMPKHRPMKSPQQLRLLQRTRQRLLQQKQKRKLKRQLLRSLPMMRNICRRQADAQMRTVLAFSSTMSGEIR